MARVASAAPGPCISSNAASAMTPRRDTRSDSDAMENPSPACSRSTRTRDNGEGTRALTTCRVVELVSQSRTQFNVKVPKVETRLSLQQRTYPSITRPRAYQ
jgi:hypothetical protein